MSRAGMLKDEVGPAQGLKSQADCGARAGYSDQSKTLVAPRAAVAFTSGSDVPRWHQA
jgi:hypothetical protein